MRIGHLVCYPNGTLQFENYSDMASSGLDGHIEVNLNDARFVRRTIGNTTVDSGYGALNAAPRNGSDAKSISMTRMRT